MATVAIEESTERRQEDAEVDVQARPASSEGGTPPSSSRSQSREKQGPSGGVRPALEHRQSMRGSTSTLASPEVQARRNIYKARVEGKDVSTSDLTHELVTCSGLLIDYVYRKRTVAADSTSVFDSLQGVLAKQAWSNVNTYRFAVGIICQEALEFQLMESITTESKARGMFAPNHPSTWRQWGQFIRKHNRDTMCLNVEVQNTLVVRKMMRLAQQPVVEPLAEKKGRLEEFWGSFHDRSRIVNNKPRDSDAKGAERPKYGMTWDLQSGPQWRIVTPVPGSLRHTELPDREKAYGNDARLGMGYRSASQPQLRKAPPAPDAGGDGVRPGTGERLPPIQSRHHYLQACDQNGKVPIPMNFMTGHSKALTADGRKMVDKELLALAKMIQETPAVEEVDLFDNASLTDAGIAKFLQKLSKESILETLRRVDIGQCVLASKQTITCITSLLKDCQGLRILNLSKIQIAHRQQLALAQAIGAHPKLETANLSETGLIPGNLTKECLVQLLRSRSLQSLDLSWNVFDGEAFQVLGENVVYNNSLRTLKVANCATKYNLGPAGDFVPPLSLFLEQLSHERGLTSLDISLNQCDFRTALILEDSLDTHKKLKQLTLDQNPLGTLGMRSILRLLCRNHTALLTFSAVECKTNIPNQTPGAAVPMPIFTYTNPGGKYNLQLWRPYHRAVLRMLYKVMERFELQPAEAFDKVVHRENLVTKNYEHPGKDNLGVFQVLTEGDLSLVFCVEKAIFKRFLSGGKSGLSEQDNTGFLARYFKDMRFQPGFKKVVPLFANWSELMGDQDAQQVFVDALSKDFSLTLPYLAQMCMEVQESANEVLYKLRPAAPEDKASKFMTNKFFHRLEDLLFTHQKLQNFLELNTANPTGHYKLELGNPSDFAVAERLLLLDRWEAAVDRKLERKDVSQYGNGSHLRNPLFQGRDLDRQYNSVAEWKLPEDGLFEVDYVSNARPLKGTEVLSNDLWDRLMVQMINSSCLPQDRILAMRSISHTFSMRSSHMRSIVGYFKDSHQRADIFIVFYLRIVDLHNSKMFMVRFPDQEEVVALQERLGYASFYPFFQPENAKFELDLAIHDQRLCASMWVNLCQKEKYPHNLHDYGYRLPDGTEDPMALGVPRSWGNFDSCPKEGRFRATYMCAPENRTFSARKELAVTYTFLNGIEELKEEEVQWWTGLTEPPEDVLGLLEFFISRYDDVKTPFTKIDGEGGNGVITLSELTEGLDAMGCHKFDKKKGDKADQRTKAQRIDSIFRYLDPGCEGSVSEQEWAVLDQLWKEFDMSIKEFVQFLILTFGKDLLWAWEALDDDESGELSEEEFLQAVEKIGYFGPAKVVFALLDSSDDGNISFDEFEVLDKYKPLNRRPMVSRPSTLPGMSLPTT